MILIKWELRWMLDRWRVVEFFESGNRIREVIEAADYRILRNIIKRRGYKIPTELQLLKNQDTRRVNDVVATGIAKL